MESLNLELPEILVKAIEVAAVGNDRSVSQLVAEILGMQLVKVREIEPFEFGIILQEYGVDIYE